MLHYRFLSLSLDGEVLVHLDIRWSPEHQTYDEPDSYLTHDLVFAFQSFLVTLEYLDEVVHASQESQPYGGDDHQDEVDVAQTTQQEHRDEDCHDDDDTAHRRDANLLDTEWVDAGITLRLGDLLAFQILDELLAKPGWDDKRYDQCKQGTEWDIPPHVGTRDTPLL